MRFATLLAIALLSAHAAPATAQDAPAPVPVEEWPLERIEAMGTAIYRQDVAAWVSTDALLAHLDGTPPPGMVGWIVVDEAAHQRVRYVRDDGGVLKAAFDVVVRDGRAGPVEAVDTPLSETEKAQFQARTTAARNIGRLRCSPQLNAVILDDPDSDDWLVWLLTTTSDANVVPMGGHYRFRISADGSTVRRRDMLSNSCVNMPRAQEGEHETAGLFITHIVSRTPVETHVFLSLQNRLPIYVAANDSVFAVEGARIRKVEN